jgi:hypothetical protein
MVRASVDRVPVALAPAIEEPTPPSEGSAEPDGQHRRRSTRQRGGRPTAAAAPPTLPRHAAALGKGAQLSANGTGEGKSSGSMQSDPVPQTGVEILAVQKENGAATYTMRDLRTSEATEGVTRENSRGLWRYAIEQREEKVVEEGHIRWKGDRGFWKTYRGSGGETRYNLALRGGGGMRIFYGVTLDGMDDEWRAVLPQRQPAEA